MTEPIHHRLNPPPASADDRRRAVAVLRPECGCRQHRFTLAECLAALAFTAIVLPVAVQAVLVTARSAELARRTDEAGQLALTKLCELSLANEWMTAEETGDFGEQHPGYTWQLATEDWDQDDDLDTSMTLLTVHVSFLVQGRSMTTSVSTLEAGTE